MTARESPMWATKIQVPSPSSSAEFASQLPPATPAADGADVAPPSPPALSASVAAAPKARGSSKMRATVAVVPLAFLSDAGARPSRWTKPAWASANAARSTDSGLPRSDGSPKIRSGKKPRAKAAHWCPAGPCPSNTPYRDTRPSPWQRHMANNTSSWFGADVSIRRPRAHTKAMRCSTRRLIALCGKHVTPFRAASASPGGHIRP
mmetsp:Transcript_42246/g.122569  ORF Transcript_42246/g.122569 Transcript_42246/m.122569 type:complete len:206 (-) Transcript_42246:1811-2428(-)